MFGLISKLAELLSAYWGRFLDGRSLDRNAEVAQHLVRVVVTIQDLCIRGERLLILAEGLFDADQSPEKSAEFTAILSEQVQSLERLQSVLDDSKTLLATVDAQFYPDMAPLIDKKSGLLVKWGQQASRGAFSTTTLFFLPSHDLIRVIEAGRASSGPYGLDGERTTYVVALAESIRNARSSEVRDIRLPTSGVQEQVRKEIVSARADLERAKNNCSALVGATETAVGSEAMARLRRKLLTSSDAN